MRDVFLFAAVAASVLHVAAGSGCVRTTADFTLGGVCQGAATMNYADCVQPEALSNWADPALRATSINDYVAGVEGGIVQSECDKMAADACT